MISNWRAGSLVVSMFLAASCNSDVPVSATTGIIPPGFQITVTRVATHPFLARYNLKLNVSAPNGCSASTELFPDTGYVSRRNLYRSSDGRIYVVGQFDARVVDSRDCSITLAEFRSLDPPAAFLGSFDVNQGQEWVYLSSNQRPERPFEKR